MTPDHTKRTVDRQVWEVDSARAGHYDGWVKTSSESPLGLGRADWIRRCAARIRSLDDVVTLVDAADLATTLCELPCCEQLSPEAAAARLFQDDLTPSQWNNDLSTLCQVPPAPTSSVGTDRPGLGD